ncbi:MAG: amidohydrolase family protein [Woeseia sp.]
MIPELLRLWFAAIVLLLALAVSAAELRLTEGTNIAADVAAGDGRVAMDLLGSVWVIPARGGDARRVVEASWQASRPRWSPDSSAILFESSLGGRTLWLKRLATSAPERITPPALSEQHGAWHPSGDRIVFVAARDASGLDVWERDIETNLDWRLTNHPGDETEPAWSADGRHLVYVLHEQDRWYLMLRRFGRAPVALYESNLPISAPAWRPDNTVITFLARNASGQLDLNMLIPSAPPLARVLVSGEDFFLAPVAWRNRMEFIYTANGVIRKRGFSARESQTLPFSAAVGRQRQYAERGNQARPLPAARETGGDLIIRARRLFDGENEQYREQVDVIIEKGVITAIEPQRSRGDAPLIDIGDSTLMPGLIDSYAGLPRQDLEKLGSLLLAFGVTTIVTPDLTPEKASQLWQSGTSMGPRVLLATPASEPPAAKDDARVRLAVIPDGAEPQRPLAGTIEEWRRRGVPVLAANWNAGLIHDADVLLGTATLPVSPGGRRYQDVQRLTGSGPLLLMSGLADSTTPGLAELQQSPQGRSVALGEVSSRRFVGGVPWLNGGTSVIVGSRTSGLPPGFATQAELLALRAAGMSAAATLAAATSAAADVLGVSRELGRIRIGARADLLLVAGDPLRDPADAGQVIAVVQNGHFHSAASLLDSFAPGTVE